MLTINAGNLQSFLEFVRISAIVGFITLTAIVVNYNHKAFSYFLGEKSKSLWWLFTLLTAIPLLIFLYLFTLIFGRLFPQWSSF